ncbi:MAG: FAD-dependent monooxygenase [Allosphingosinicella sp.]
MDAEVVIVGGGPVGLGLAVELGQAGVETILIERHREIQRVPKGQNLTQRTMEHFHFWGAEKELRARRPLPASSGIAGLTAYGTLLGGYDYDWLQRELVRPYYFTDNERLPQYETEAVLRARTTELPSVSLLYGWTGSAVAQDKEGVTVEAEATNGTGCARLRSHFLVGCEGSRSRIREWAGIEQQLVDHDKRMVLLVFRSEGLTRLLSRFPDKSYFNVLHPELDGYWQFLGRVDLDDNWFFHAPVPLEVSEQDLDFADLLHRAVGAQFDVDFGHIGFWDLRFAVARTYRAERVFIAGDAAHSHPPYGGYGINTGFEDARNLGWKLAATLRGWGGPALLDSYDAERRPVFESTSRDFIERAIEQDRRFLRAFDPDRNRTAFEEAWASRGASAAGEVAAFEPHYEGSPLIFGPPGGTSGAAGEHRLEARAGHHLAPAELTDGRNVYEALGRGFTLLALDAAEEDIAEFRNASSSLGVPLSVIADDADGGRARYRARLVLVRPDQFVAWAGQDCERAPKQIVARAAGFDPVGL